MAVPVVDQLEVVEIADDQRQVVAEAARRIELAAQAVVERTPVEQPGERIRPPLPPQPRRLAEEAQQRPREPYREARDDGEGQRRDEEQPAPVGKLACVD